MLRFPFHRMALAAALILTVGAGVAQAESRDQQLYERGVAALDDAMSLPPGQWDSAAAPAVALLQEAAGLGHEQAMNDLGMLYEHGIGVPRDRDQAMALYRASGDAGFVQSYQDGMLLAADHADWESFTDMFVVFYQADSGWAVDALDLGPKRGRIAVQGLLIEAEIYIGPQDGELGQGTRAALKAYFNPVTAPEDFPNAQTSPEELAVAVQTELARLGCYHGKIDGKFGPASRQALRNFAHWAGASFPNDNASVIAWETVASTPGPVCGVD